MKVSAPEYPQFLASLKATIRERQYQALRAVNHELLALYLEIGEAIYRKQEDLGWGKAVVETLAHDLQAEFPGRNGFSARNIWNMKDLYFSYRDLPKLQPLVAEISWAKNLVILARCKDPLQREFYLRATARPFQHVCRISRFSTARRVFPQTPRGSTGPHSKMRFAEKGKMQPVENFHRFDKLKHCMVLPEAFYPTGSIEKYGSAFICIRKTLINRNLQFYAEKCNIEPQPSAGAVARWINRRLTRRVRAWERPNQITLINTDQRRHGGIRMANRAEKTNPLQASLRQVRFFSANPARGIIRAQPRYPWLGPLQLRSARGLLKNYPEVRLEISESGHGLLLSFLRVDLQPESQPESQPEFKLEQRVMALLQTQALGKKQISEVNQKY